LQDASSFHYNHFHSRKEQNKRQRQTSKVPTSERPNGTANGTATAANGTANGTGATATAAQPTKGSIFPAMLSSFAFHFFLSAIFKLFTDLLSFASPLILGALITYVASDGALWKGLILTFALFGVTFLMAVLNGQNQFMSYQVGFRIRTALISSIYRKSLRISSAAKRSTTAGEIVNLMAVDAHRFFELLYCRVWR